MVKLIDIQKEFLRRGFKPDDDFNIVKINDDVFSLSVKERANSQAIDEKIYQLIQEKNLKERVQGYFEKFLNEKARQRLKELLDSGRIEIYKQSDKYNKGFYCLAGKHKKASEIAKIELEKRNEKEIIKAPEKIIGKKEPEVKKEIIIERKEPERKSIEIKSSYSEKKSNIIPDGLIVTQNDFQAKALSQQYYNEIKEGKIKGMKSFDGFYYIIESNLLEEAKQKVVSLLESSKAVSLNDLISGSGLQKNIIRTAIEFLKEEGMVIEKKKEIFSIIG